MRDNLNKTLRILYKNYPFTTLKVAKQYRESIFYQRIVKKFNRDLLTTSKAVADNTILTPIIQFLPPSVTIALCQLEQSGDLDKLVRLIKVISK